MRSGGSALWVILALAMSALTIVGCQSTRKTPSHAGPAMDRALPSYDEIARRFNERADRLSRVWARAVVSITFRNEKGDRRSEQGEGHFQMIQPNRLALSVGKLGEVIVWIGCDEHRYWFIDAKESKRAFVGRHEQTTPEKIASLGIPAAPRDLIRLAGASPLPLAAPDIIYGWAPGGIDLIVEQRIDNHVWRYTIDEQQMRPIRIELLQASDRAILVSASLEDYAPVTLQGVGGYFPMIASRVTAAGLFDESQIRVSLAGMNDGGRSRLGDDNFDFESLVQALGVSDVIDLDSPVAAR